VRHTRSRSTTTLLTRQLSWRYLRTGEGSKALTLRERCTAAAWLVGVGPASCSVLWADGGYRCGAHWCAGLGSVCAIQQPQQVVGRTACGARAFLSTQL
jgi:hypothetical protein